MAKKNTQVFQESCTLSLYWFERRFQEYILKFAYIWIANFNASTAPSLIFEYIYNAKNAHQCRMKLRQTTRTPASTSPVSLAAGPSASPPPKISRASSEPLFHAPEEAKANPPPLPPPDSPPSKCDEPIESDLYWWTKEVGDCEYLSPVFGSLPVFLGTCEEGTYSDSGDESPVSQVPLPENKAWGFESISLSHIMLTWSNAPCFYIYNWLYLYHPCIYQRHVLITSYILHGIYQKPTVLVWFMGNPFNI